MQFSRTGKNVYTRARENCVTQSSARLAEIRGKTDIPVYFITYAER